MVERGVVEGARWREGRGGAGGRWWSDCSKVQFQPLCLQTLCAVLCPVFPAGDELDSWSFPSSAWPLNGVSGIYKIAMISSAFSPNSQARNVPPGFWNLET